MERSIKITLNGIDRINRFFAINKKTDLDILVKSGVYVVDGKSQMGVYSLDISKEVEVVVSGKDEAAVETLIHTYRTEFVDRND